MAAIIRSLRNGLSAVVGSSREDLRSGDVLTLNSVDVHTTYSWTILFAPDSPAGAPSSASLSAPNAAVTTFTVDNEGAYLVRLLLDFGLGTEDTQIVRLRYVTVFGDLKLVAAGERRDGTGVVPVDISAEGWTNDQNLNLQTLLGFVSSVSTSGRTLYVDANRGTDYSNSPSDPAVSEGYADFDSINSAISAAAGGSVAPSPTNPYMIRVRPGLYVEDLALVPHVHVVGSPGSSFGEEDRTIRVMAASLGHTSALAGSGDFTIVSGLLLENTNLVTTDPVLKKTGSGTLFIHRCCVSQSANAATQGPALGLEGGSVHVDESEIVSVADTAPTRVAFSQEGASTVSTFVRSSIRGAGSAVEINAGLAAGTTALFLHSTIESDMADAGAFAVRSDAELTRIEYSDVRTNAASVRGVEIHVGASVIATDLIATIRWSRITSNILFDTTNAGGVTSLELGSVEYGAISISGALTAGEHTALTKSASLFYDNTSTSLVATNVQDALDEVFGISSEFVVSRVTVSGPTTHAVSANTDYIGVDTSGGPVTLELADGVTVLGNVNGRVLIVKDESGDAATNNITVLVGTAGAGGGIDSGGGSLILNVDDEGVLLVCNGASSPSTLWYSIASSGPAHITRDIPLETPNGLITQFTLNTLGILTGSEEVFLNGIQQDPGSGDYTFTLPNIIDFNSAPSLGETVRVNYLTP